MFNCLEADLLKKLPDSESLPETKNEKKTSHSYVLWGGAALIIILISLFAWSPWITDEKAIQMAEKQVAAEYPDPVAPQTKICSFCRETTDEVYRKSGACNGCFAEKREWTISAESKIFGKEITARAIGPGSAIETKYFISALGKITPVGR